jgi:hypothetical protein
MKNQRRDDEVTMSPLLGAMPLAPMEESYRRLMRPIHHLFGSGFVLLP